MQWTRTETLALAQQSCTMCFGLGLREGLGGSVDSNVTAFSEQSFELALTDLKRVLRRRSTSAGSLWSLSQAGTRRNLGD
jgi:hypothetical protein